MVSLSLLIILEGIFFIASVDGSFGSSPLLSLSQPANSRLAIAVANSNFFTVFVCLAANDL
jgi:hypothetical protein